MLIAFAAAAWGSELLDGFSLPDSPAFIPTSGWTNGYPADPWRVEGGRVGATRDDGGGDWGTAAPIDNWLVRSDVAFRDLTLEVTLSTGDDDAMGVVFRWESATRYYLALFSPGDLTPSPGTGGAARAIGGWLYRVEDGVATVLASTPAAIVKDGTHGVRIVAEGASLEVWLDANSDGTLQTDERVMTATDDKFPQGGVGFYCYDNATAGCWFDDLAVVGRDARRDADDDGVFETEDCDDADELVAVPSASWPDADDDGFGDADSEPVTACHAPEGNVDNSRDCDDADPDVHPAALEACNGNDDDCDGVADDGAVDQQQYYGDADGDGYGDGDATEEACSPPEGFVSGEAGFDCDDADPDAHPGAEEVWYDGIDQDCDGGLDGDRDEDGVIAGEAGGPDCDDLDPAIQPASVDTPDDGVDQNCNGTDAITYAGRPACRCATGTAGGAGWVALVGLLTRRRRRR